ncbi:MAG: class I SAM-dependent methyltransferase family protein [Haloarculaceae archaeon]
MDEEGEGQCGDEFPGQPQTRGSDDRLAVVVAKPRAEAAIDALQAEGVYDPDRSVREYGDDAVSVPVTAVPETVSYREVVRQVGEPRLRDLADHLRERGWTDAEIARAPSSWAVLGTVVLVEMGDAPRPAEVGEALLALHGEADTVLSRGGIDGAHREPDVEVVAGEGDTETVHTEHGTRYAMDLAAVMFSPGNKAERARMGEAAAAGERVVDMFAGIGYFTLPMARAGAEVTAIERNPTAFRYLLENVRLNGVADRVRPYRADCRDVLARAGSTSDGEGPGDGADAAEVAADRVVMGYYEAHEYLDAALSALGPGGVVHLHEATPEALVFDRPVERLRSAARERGRSVDVLDARRVKGYSEGVAHVVVDARVS